MTDDGNVKIDPSKIRSVLATDCGSTTTKAILIALVDGEFGLLVVEGSASFDDLDVRTNDAQFADEQALLAADSPILAYRGEDLTRNELDLLVDAAAKYWIAAGRDPELLSDLRIEITDLPNQQLGRVHENTIYIDRNAAGHGWFVDSTPFDSGEYRADTADGLNALSGGDADGRMDLLSVVIHEIGHLLGEDHDTSALMDTSLEAGVREVDLAGATESETDMDSAAVPTAAESVVETLASGRQSGNDTRSSTRRAPSCPQRSAETACTTPCRPRHQRRCWSSMKSAANSSRSSAASPNRSPIRPMSRATKPTMTTGRSTAKPTLGHCRWIVWVRQLPRRRRPSTGMPTPAISTF